LCQAIFGQPVGAEVEYRMGELRAVKILALAEDGPAPGIKIRREENLLQNHPLFYFPCSIKSQIREYTSGNRLIINPFANFLYDEEKRKGNNT
jgi:hypothetical protein